MNYRCTLVSDGSSDRMLVPVLKWALDQQFPRLSFDFEFGDVRLLTKANVPLAAKVKIALDYFPCDILFVHRDAEKEPLRKREAEIDFSLAEIRAEMPMKVVKVIPVRMSEAWLLISESAIRKAVGNPNGKVRLDLPGLKKLEGLPDPKGVLEKLLETASELNSRRLKSFRSHSAMHRLAEIIEDYSPLKNLSAFQQLEREIIALNL